MKIKQSYDCFISTIGFPVLIRHLYIESDPICERTEIDPKSVTDGPSLPSGSWCNSYVPSDTYIYPRADSRFAPSQWETALQSSAESHWLGTNLESALYPTRLTARNLDTDEASTKSFSWSSFYIHHGVIITCSILSKFLIKDIHSSPVRVRYEVSFVSWNCNSCSSYVTAVLYAISGSIRSDDYA